MSARTLRFMLVGAVGFLVQLSVLWALNVWAHWTAALATIVAVEAAVLANFVSHERWTWKDRCAADTSRLARLGRFHLSNGLASIAGNVLATLLLVRVGVHPVTANGVAVGLMSLWNFLAADRWVFLGQAATVTIVVVTCAESAFAGEPAADTVAAWSRHIATLEASLTTERPGAPLSEPEGRAIAVPQGMIHEWRGSVIVPNITVAELIDLLEHPESLPPQEDVAETRVLSRNQDSLRVYFKLVRRFIVSVTYDSEHDVRYVRRSASLATSKSVATRIAEQGGTDHGFLWRLNSYWQYRQVGDDVVVDILSVSLSREVPFFVKAVAGPIIERIGRESMVHTLAMVRAAPDAARQRRSTSH